MLQGGAAKYSFSCEDDLSKYLTRLGSQYSQYTKGLWELGVRTSRELANASTATLKTVITSGLHLDNIKATATGEEAPEVAAAVAVADKPSAGGAGGSVKTLTGADAAAKAKPASSVPASAAKPDAKNTVTANAAKFGSNSAKPAPPITRTALKTTAPTYGRSGPAPGRTPPNTMAGRGGPRPVARPTQYNRQQYNVGDKRPLTGGAWGGREEVPWQGPRGMKPGPPPGLPPPQAMGFGSHPQHPWPDPMMTSVPARPMGHMAPNFGMPPPGGPPPGGRFDPRHAQQQPVQYMPQAASVQPPQLQGGYPPRPQLSQQVQQPGGFSQGVSGMNHHQQQQQHQSLMPWQARPAAGVAAPPLQGPSPAYSHNGVMTQWPQQQQQHAPVPQFNYQDY